MNKSKLILSMIALSLSLFLTACGEGSKSKSNGTVTANSCQTGQLWVSSYNGCFATAPCVQYGSNYAYVPAVNQCLPGTSASPGGSTGQTHLWTGTLVYTGGGQGVYQNLIKDAGVCGGGWLNSFSGYNCDQWNDYARIQLEVKSNGSMPAYTYVDIFASYDYNSSISQLVTFEGTSQLTENSTKFVLQSLGTGTGYNKLFRATSNIGSLNVNGQLVPTVRLTFTYNGVEFGYSDLLLTF